MSFSIELVQYSVRKGAVAEIGVKTLFATVVFLEIGAMCKKAENCAKQRAQL